MINPSEDLIPEETKAVMIAICDKIIEREWARGCLIDEETETILEEWFGFPIGANRHDIWRHIDKCHSKGVVYLINGEES